MKWSLFGLVVWLAVAASAPAELVFEQRILELPATPGLHEVSGVFRFQNTGREDVTIRKVRTSCGCTSAKLEKMTYAPGEKGEIATTFRFGFAKGKLRKLLSVELADATEIPLEIHTLVLVPISAKPTLVFWRQGSEAGTKRVSIGLQPNLPMRVDSVVSDNPAFETKLTEEGDGRYALEVTPHSTSEKSSGQITIKTDYPPENPATVTIYARVR